MSRSPLALTGIALFTAALIVLTGCASSDGSGASPAYFNIVLVDSASAEDVAQMQDDLAANPRVVSVDYVSKEEALAQFKAEMADSPEVVEQVEGNPLPAALVVTIRSEDDYDALYQAVEDHPLFYTIVDGADDQGGWIRYH